MLVGGKNVVYSYSEAFDGSQASALLVGGFGSNTLTGGTMMFGNFIPADRISQAKAHFANASGFDSTGQALINSRIDAAVGPANPAGIIGAKMTGSRGGLLMGGPGNNSFIAMGAGVYEMIGGSWMNSFNISPSFSGGAATYHIDAGGPGAGSLTVRVPIGEMADFENGTVPDKYSPQFKALDISSNAGLFTTAHGISNVVVIGSPGSSIVLGDTSELDIAFKIKGSATLKFAGTAAPDVFDVTSQYDPVYSKTMSTANNYAYYGTKNHRSPMQLSLYPRTYEDIGTLERAFEHVVKLNDAHYTYFTYNGSAYPVWVAPRLTANDRPYIYASPSGGLFDYFSIEDFPYSYDDYHVWFGTGEPEGYSSIYPDSLFSHIFDGPLYTVARTFGTNGHTQSISFDVDEVASSSIVLDGRGESDQYNINPGLGSFLDIRIEDSDSTKQNSLLVSYTDTTLLSYRATLTDNSLRLDYYTPLQFKSYELGIETVLDRGPASVAYSPTVFFGANTDITFGTTALFQQTIVNRPAAPQKATIRFGEAFKAPFARDGMAYDPEQTNPAFLIFEPVGFGVPVDVQANAGILNFEMIENPIQIGPGDSALQLNVHSNTGAISFKTTKYFESPLTTLKVDSNAGAISFETLMNSARPTTQSVSTYANTGTISFKTSDPKGAMTWNIDSYANTGTISFETIEQSRGAPITFNVHSNAAASPSRRPSQPSIPQL